MEQNLLEQAVVAIEDLPDDARNVLHALEFFPVFESAPQSYKLLLDYEPLRESLRFFVFMCDAITRNKEGQPPAYNSELGLRFLRRALSAAKGCLAVARHGRARPLNTMEELLNHSTQGEQDEQDEGGSEETYISILRNSWLVVHAVLIFCSEYVVITM